MTEHTITVPTLWVHIVAFNWPGAERGAEFAAGPFTTPEEAEASLEFTRRIWNRSGRENVDVYVQEYSPVPF